MVIRRKKKLIINNLRYVNLNLFQYDSNFNLLHMTKKFKHSISIQAKNKKKENTLLIK